MDRYLTIVYIHKRNTTGQRGHASLSRIIRHESIRKWRHSHHLFFRKADDETDVDIDYLLKK